MPANMVLILGQEGTGKSSAARTLPPGETVVISPNAKQLPFAGSKKNYVLNTKDQKGNLFVTRDMTMIPAILDAINKRPEIKYVLLDDFTHFMNAHMMNDAFVANKDWGKWNIFGKDVYKSISGTAETMRDDLFIFVNAHTEINDEGVAVFQSAGKLLDNVIKPMSYFTYVLHTDVIYGKKENDQSSYEFLTNRSNNKAAKTPPGMFPLRIPNDLLAVAEGITKYNLGE